MHSHKSIVFPDEPGFDSAVYGLGDQASGVRGDIPWHMEGGRILVNVPGDALQHFTGKYAYTFKIEKAE